MLRGPGVPLYCKRSSASASLLTGSLRAPSGKSGLLLVEGFSQVDCVSNDIEGVGRKYQVAR